MSMAMQEHVTIPIMDELDLATSSHKTAIIYDKQVLRETLGLRNPATRL